MPRITIPALLLLLSSALVCASSKDKVAPHPFGPELQLDGGRRLVFDRNFNSEREVRTNRKLWTKLVDFVAGEPTYHFLVRPYSIATDSRGRVIITDPGAYGIHIFDFEQKKYKFISHTEGKDELREPQCVAIDKQDNIYVSDSGGGKIFVFSANGKLQRVIGGLKGGEGYFKRPTGIAVDSENGRIYVSDTWRNQIFVMDMKGSVLKRIGKTGQGPGEFNYPTELRLDGDDLLVVDAMNFRIQTFDRTGAYRSSFGQAGDGRGATFRPKGVSADSEGHLYVADALANLVQVFDREGQLLYYFGKEAGIGDFLLPAGIAIDAHDRVLVVDSYHRRVQVFQYYGLASRAARSAQ